MTFRVFKVSDQFKKKVIRIENKRLDIDNNDTKS